MKSIFNGLLAVALFSALFFNCKKSDSTVVTAPARDKFIGLYTVTASDLPHMPLVGTTNFGIYKGTADNEIILDAGGFVGTVDGEKVTFGRNVLDPETAFTGVGYYNGGNLSISWDVEATATTAAHSAVLGLHKQ